jgi:hypothetical protein
MVVRGLSMRSAVTFALVLLLSGSVLAQKAGPEVPYKGAVEYLGNLDMANAYKWADTVIRDFPDSEEARKARVLKALISTIQLQTYDMLSTKYAEGIRKAVLYEHKKRNRDLYVETTRKALDQGEALLVDMRAIFSYVGTPMSLDIPKSYDSLDVLKDGYVPHEMLLKGFPPTRDEDKRVRKHQLDMSFCYVLSRVYKGAAPGSDYDVAKAYEKRQLLNGQVDWSGVLSVMGDWLVHYGSICKVGWIDLEKQARLRNPSQAKKGYEAAKRCFEKVIKLNEDDQYDKGKVRAEERLKEIDETIDTLK